MPSHPVVLNTLIADLRRVETWLSTTLGVSVEEQDKNITPSPFAPPDDLSDLKIAIDQIRPLLWVYLTRQREANAAKKDRNNSAEVRTLMEDALRISDRYVRKD